MCALLLICTSSGFLNLSTSLADVTNLLERLRCMGSNYKSWEGFRAFLRYLIDSARLPIVCSEFAARFNIDFLVLQVINLFGVCGECLSPAAYCVNRFYPENYTTSCFKFIQFSPVGDY